MRIALLGGTGHIGEGLALRWAPKHDVMIGSRSAEKAEEAAAFCEELLLEEGTTCELSGEENVQAIADCDVVVLALQYQYAMPTAVAIKEKLDPSAIVVSPVVPMTKDGFLRYEPSKKYGSAALEIQSVLSDNEVVSAFHTTPAARLIDLKDSAWFGCPRLWLRKAEKSRYGTNQGYRRTHSFRCRAARGVVHARVDHPPSDKHIGSK